MIQSTNDFLKIVEAKPLEYFTMLLRFNTGETKIFDMTEIYDAEAFVPLQDETRFKNVKLVNGVCTWEQGQIDLAPEFMYEKGYLYDESELLVAEA